MRKITRLAAILVLAVSAPFFGAGAPAASQSPHLKPDGRIDVEAIRKTIRTLGLRFTVEENRFTRMSPEERAMLAGAAVPEDPGPVLRRPVLGPDQRDDYFDWRNINGVSYVSGIRDQGACGSCWDFAAVAILESAMMIDMDRPNTDPDYSEQYMLSCIDDAGWPGSTCAGGYMGDAVAFLEVEGTPTEACFPYAGIDYIPCANACPQAETECRKLADSYSVTGSNVDIDAINTALQAGPVGTWFEIWDNFYAYGSGIYSAYGSTYTGYNHFVLIVGYDDVQQCWIAKNSWGESWGEDGFFRVAYDSGCYFGFYTIAAGFEGAINVTDPNAATVLTHGQTNVPVSYYGSTGDSIYVDIYQSQQYVGSFLPWTEESGGSLLRTDPVPAQWGVGAGFQLYLANNAGEDGWSQPFFIVGEAQWTDAAQPPVNDAGKGYAAAWGDAGGDGFPDLYLANSEDPSRLFHNDGGVFFSDATAPPLNLSTLCRGLAWADQDNDGDLDLYVSVTSEYGSHLFDNLGGGSFADITPLPGSRSYTNGIAWGDYDADGFVDLYIANVFRADTLLHNEGGGAFSVVSGPPWGDAGCDRAAVWTDFDDDGDLDLFVLRNGPNHLYRNDGSVFVKITGMPPLTTNGNHYGAAWGDYDNDGDRDVFIVSQGYQRLLQNQAGIGFTDVSFVLPSAAGGGLGAVWFDYDNDGWLDLYLVNNGPNALFRNEGDGTFSDRTDPLLQGSDNTKGVACADYDLDGRLDLYVVNDDAPNLLLHNESSAGNHWLHVNLQGDPSNRAALGARVRLFAGGLMQTREIGSETGGVSQSSLTVEFGLGAAIVADSLQVFWPSGAVTSEETIGCDQICLIREGGGTPVDEGQIPRLTALHPNHPNPFNPETTLAFSLAERQRVGLAIFDAGGRRVAVLADGIYGAGRHELTWRGRDDRGAPLATGVYFARLDLAGGVLSQKLVLIK